MKKPRIIFYVCGAILVLFTILGFQMAGHSSAGKLAKIISTATEKLPAATATVTATATTAATSTSAPTATVKSSFTGGQLVYIANNNTAVMSSPGGNAVAHVNQHFQFALTGLTAMAGGAAWAQVNWSTGFHEHAGWVPVSAIKTSNFSGAATAGMDTLSPTLNSYLNSQNVHIGVVVYLPSKNRYFEYNSGDTFTMASSFKVPIMLTLLAQKEQQNQLLSDTENQELTGMIENSDNDDADALYNEVNNASGVNAFLGANGISGFDPDDGHWGLSTTTPRSMVNLLNTFYYGNMLTSNGRSYALNLMENIEADQRFGVGDTAPDGATVAMKDGWLQPDQYWAMNSSGIVQSSGLTYIVSVYTYGSSTQGQGTQILDTVCQDIANAMD